jgi:transposase
MSKHHYMESTIERLLISCEDQNITVHQSKTKKRNRNSALDRHADFVRNFAVKKCRSKTPREYSIEALRQQLEKFSQRCYSKSSVSRIVEKLGLREIFNPATQKDKA